jgi:hypothetical protein
MDGGWAVSGCACFGEDAQLRPRLRPAGEPAKQDSGPGDHGGGKRQGDEIESGEGHAADDSAIESTPLRASRRSRAAASLLGLSAVTLRGDLSAAGALRNLSTFTGRRDLSTVTALRNLSTVVRRRDLSTATSAAASGATITAAAAGAAVDLIVDLLGRRGVLVQRGIELCARKGR